MDLFMAQGLSFEPESLHYDVAKCIGAAHATFHAETRANPGLFMHRWVLHPMCTFYFSHQGSKACPLVWEAAGGEEEDIPYHQLSFWDRRRGHDLYDGQPVEGALWCGGCSGVPSPSCPPSSLKIILFRQESLTFSWTFPSHSENWILKGVRKVEFEHNFSPK